MNKVLVILAHPLLQHSRVNWTMIDKIRGLPHIAIHDLYETYPDFFIDIEREKQALETAHTVVFQHPFQWYSCPSLMKEWIDTVLLRGWAYGDGGTALLGKRFMSAITTGGPHESYHPEGANRFMLHELLRPFEQTARLCGMEYLEPIIFCNALQADNATVNAHAEHYRNHLTRLAQV